MSNSILEMIIDEKKLMLDKVEFIPNDYATFLGDAQLEVTDKVEFKELIPEGFVVSISRLIDSPEEGLFSVFVSYDEFVKFSDNVDETSVTEEFVKNEVDANKAYFANYCMAKISLLISQITSQIASGLPIVTSPVLMEEEIT